MDIFVNSSSVRVVRCFVIEMFHFLLMDRASMSGCVRACVLRSVHAARWRNFVSIFQILFEETNVNAIPPLRLSVAKHTRTRTARMVCSAAHRTAQRDIYVEMAERQITIAPHCSVDAGVRTRNVFAAKNSVFLKRLQPRECKWNRKQQIVTGNSFRSLLFFVVSLSLSFFSVKYFLFPFLPPRSSQSLRKKQNESIRSYPKAR